ncbi:hypothetical protein [Ramlibacter sp.]|uniref:hypothetical protein n=1 Tax=Ramlibacter sp. TaxID=1917967 RepID=UPI003D121967
MPINPITALPFSPLTPPLQDKAPPSASTLPSMQVLRDDNRAGMEALWRRHSTAPSSQMFCGV